MKIISINLGIEKEIQMGDRIDRTGIYKYPVPHAVRITELGLEGDFIESKKHHGGPDQAVYIYGSADYAWWEKELGVEIQSGTFGENLTIRDLESGAFNIGDLLHIGDATLEVTMPRIPCSTFAARMGDPAWVKKFRQAERPGFYCRVKREGVIKAGDAVALEKFKGEAISIRQLYQDYYEKNKTEAMLRRHLAAPIAIRWRERMKEEIVKLSSKEMNKNDIIQKTVAYIKEEFSDDSSGHDWWHIYRVWKNAVTLCKHENADRFIVELAALLHDLDDWKFNESGDETPLRARAWLEACSVDISVADAVCEIIKHVSYKGAGVENKMKSLEGFIVQDADRLDAIGAIGIGRAFAYGGYKNRMMYDPDSPPNMHATFEEYKNSKSATINHFYEKLLLLKDMMNTNSAKRIAKQRHEVMVKFLDQFMNEWEGKDVSDSHL